MLKALFISISMKNFFLLKFMQKYKLLITKNENNFIKTNLLLLAMNFIIALFLSQ